MLRAPATPIASVNPAKTQLLLLEPDRYPPIAELAQPMLRLAGLRINPRNNGSRSPQASFRGLELVNLSTLQKTTLPLPAGARFGTAQWNPQGDMAAFPAMFDDRIELYLLDVKAGKLKPVPAVRLNAAYGDSIDWLPGGRTILIQAIPAQRGRPPRQTWSPQAPISRNPSARPPRPPPTRTSSKASTTKPSSNTTAPPNSPSSMPSPAR